MLTKQSARGRRALHAHAIRYKKDHHGALERIQIDVDVYRLQGVTWYHFSAIHISTRYAWGRAYAAVNARCGAAFLAHVLSTLPAGIRVDAVQVDGGSEFKAEFADYCHATGMILLVNHPNTPKQNAHVERLHYTFQHEMYDTRIFSFTCSAYQRRAG